MSLTRYWRGCDSKIDAEADFAMILSEMLRKIDCPAELLRDGSFTVLEQCTRIRAPEALTYLENRKYLGTLEHPDISCVICIPELADQLPSHIGGIAVTRSPKLLFFLLHNMLVAQREKIPTKIDPSAEISPQAYIAPYGVVIGPGVQIDPFVAVYENSTIMQRVHICAGTVIGGQSFTAVRDTQGGMFLAKDAGGVLIEEYVEICADCHIACGTLGKDLTVVGSYSKLDAKVHIGHGTVLGKRVLVPSGAHIAGNCVVGDDVWVGVNATISNRITIGDGARVSLGSVVTKEVPAGQTVSGNFAIDHQKFLSNLKKSLEE